MTVRYTLVPSYCIHDRHNETCPPRCQFHVVREPTHWWLTVAPGRMYLLKRHDETSEWLAYQPGRLVARQPTRGQAVSAVLRDLDEGVL